MDCDYREEVVSIELKFDVCREHENAKIKSISTEYSGVFEADLVEVLLGLSERLLSHQFMNHPDVQRYVSGAYPNGEGENEVVGERGRKLLNRLFAQQFMLKTVADRSYETGGSDTMLTMPRF